MTESLRSNPYREYKKFMSNATIYDLRTDWPDVDGGVWSIRRGQVWPDKVLKAGNYLYVLMPDGELRIPRLPHTQLDMHHPQLAKRKPVIGAGVLSWSGVDITCIDNKSGCYIPDAWSIPFVTRALKFYGVPFNPDYKEDDFIHLL